VRINCKVLQVGRTMAMMRGEITSLDGKVSYSVCEHHKVSVPTPQGNLTHKIAWDEEWERETKAKAKAKI
jgi:acyl-coenzyme A thioesterase 13